MSEVTICSEFQAADSSPADALNLLTLAAAIGERRTWEGYEANVRTHLDRVSPGDDSSICDRSFQLNSGLRTGDRQALLMLGVEGYLHRRVEDKSVTQVTTAAEHLNTFALELQRTGVKFTHAGATSEIIAGIENLQETPGRLSTEVYSYSNQVLHAMRARHIENRLRLGAKITLVTLGALGIAGLKRRTS